MKHLILLLSLFCTALVSASGYYGTPEINTYDPASGLYYKAIVDVSESKGGLLSSSKSARKITNIAIYNPKTDTHSLLFKKDKKRKVVFTFFESAYKDQAILFNGEGVQYSTTIKNNRLVPERKLKDKLLVGVDDSENKVTILWVAKKDGSALQKLATVKYGTTWHIDVKNSVVRNVMISNQDLVVKNYPW